MHRQILASLPLLAAIACAQDRPAAGVPLARLGNPVIDARAALAGGDSSYIALMDPDLIVLGVTTADPAAEQSATVRAFSRRSLGLTSDAWLAQRDSLRVYTAAYNRLVAEARRAAREHAT